VLPIHSVEALLDIDFDNPAPAQLHQRLPDRFQGEMG
jgi:hypothetical protein